MEIILAVLQPKQNVIAGIEYRPKLYNILLLDYKTTLHGEKSKVTKYLPTFTQTSSEEPRDEVLTHLFHITGGELGGIKGERAIQVQWNKQTRRESMTKFALYCVPINMREKVNRVFTEKSSSSPGLFSLDYVIDTFNNGTVNYPPPTKFFISQLESWLREKHQIAGVLDMLFCSRAEYRVKYSISNPAYLPSHYDIPTNVTDQNLMVSSPMPEEIRQTANEAMTKMLAIEKCDIVVINPIFGSGLPYRTKVDNFVKNMYWGREIPDYSSLSTPSTSSSYESLYSELHKYARDGNLAALSDKINQGYYVNDIDSKRFTALHWAAWSGHAEAAKLLLDFGAKPNLTNNLGQTPLHIAAYNGFPQVVEVLLKYPDTNIEVYDSSHKTALNYCEEQLERSPPHSQIYDILKSALKQASQLSVHIVDGSKRLLRLSNGKSTTVQQLNRQLLRDFKIPDAYAEVFTIWICSESLELQLKQHHRPMEHLNNWTKKIVGMLTDGDPKQEEPRLKWRRNAKIGLSDEKQIQHEKVIYLLFHEAYQNYIKALYPCKDNDVCMFASIYIFMHQNGDYEVSHAKSFVREHLKTLVPEPMLKAKGHNWPTRILDFYKKYCANLKDEISSRNETVHKYLHMKFLECSRNLTVYGSAFFTGNLHTPGVKGNNSTACHIGINDVGIHIIDSKSRVMLQSFRYTEIQWSLPDISSLDIKVKRFEGKFDRNSTPRQIAIRTKQAGLIDHLMKKLSQMHALDDRVVDIRYSRGSNINIV
ncbi:hypothetical protein FSP39_023274 [Pinctada imbricata]|uniref:FERM domain-containing protein n=1 Tax=Pinctada imbricata TaxID=66713 RepID=A0AA89BV51_PINIB|nr:hypothetical protein FSP39_023274 [Pinctada imbricata]